MINMNNCTFGENRIMVFELVQNNTIGNQFIHELRDANIQKDSMRFRRNLERLGEIFAYEISKTLNYKTISSLSPLGIAMSRVPASQVVLATILRAGLPLHQGMLNYYDNAGNAFISAYRKHHRGGSFDIQLEYLSCPDINGTTLIISDPMLATGSSMELSIKALLENGQPESIHIVSAIGAKDGVAHIQRIFPDVHIWIGAIDEELTAKAYIVPGLGDAGDLSFGSKQQE